MHLQLVVADLYLERDAFDGGRTAALPRLPGLEAVLRWGRRGAAQQDWRGFAAEAAGRVELAGLPPAPVVAAAAGVDRPWEAWFATPVHQVAGIDHLRLHPAGLLRLAAAEQAALAAGFNDSFAADGLRLWAAGTGFLLSGLRDVDACAQDPARFLGADLRAAPARGPAAARLRRLGAEIEMWLHARAASQARARRGLAVNALWLWGGGRAPEPAPPWRGSAAAGPASADEVYVQALWALGGREAQPLPAAFADLPREASGTSPSRLVCVGAAPREPGDAPLSRLDDAWFAPAVAALRDGRLAALTLHAGGWVHTLRRRDLWRLWRRARPWWEGLAA